MIFLDESSIKLAIHKINMKEGFYRQGEEKYSDALTIVLSSPVPVNDGGGSHRRVRRKNMSSLLHFHLGVLMQSITIIKIKY